MYIKTRQVMRLLIKLTLVYHLSGRVSQSQTLVEVILQLSIILFSRFNPYTYVANTLHYVIMIVNTLYGNSLVPLNKFRITTGLNCR